MGVRLRKMPAFVATLVIILATLGSQPPAQSAPARVTAVASGPWSNPGTWSCRCVPGSSHAVIVPEGHTVTVDSEAAAAASLTVHGTLGVSRDKSTALTLHGNFVLYGTLNYQTRQKARVRWVNVRESQEVGDDTMEPLDSDPGLWVQRSGRVVVQGEPKTAWARITGALAVGATELTLDRDVSGWRIGDELAITPTLPPSDPDFSTAYDYVTIIAVTGREVTFRAPVQFAHPAVEVAPGTTLTAEVLNLTRNISFSGQPGGRAHVIFNHATALQRIEYAELQYMGPRRSSEGVLGRYALHFHMMADASRGSLVEGVVVRDSGNHAFVPHASHGITFRQTIAHNVMGDAYWWDVSPRSAPAIETHDTVIEAAVASLVGSGRQGRLDHRLTGFALLSGTGNTLRNSIAVGVQGGKNASGMQWPERGGAVWAFQDNLAHNNRSNGIFVWQNNPSPHEITRFTAFHNGRNGIEHGAYWNLYYYRDVKLYANGQNGLFVLADSMNCCPPRALSFVGGSIDQRGLSEFAINFGGSSTARGTPGRTLVRGLTLRGYTKAAIGFTTDLSRRSGTGQDRVDIVDCRFGGNQLWLEPTINPASVIRIQDSANGSYEVRRADAAMGTSRPTWNAKVLGIQPFAP